MKTIISIIFLCAILVGAQAAADKEEEIKTLAILPFENTQPNLQPLANALPDILITELVSVPSLRLVERSKINQAQKALEAESNAFGSEEEKLKIGKWLGAEYLMMGSITKIFSNIRIDLRIIDVNSGTIHFATGSEGKEHEINDLVNQIGIKSRNALEANKNEKSINSISTAKEFSNTPKKVSVRFNVELKLGVFTTRSFPVQMVRLYVNGKLAGQSDPLNQFNRKWDLFEAELPVGSHSILLEHGSVNRQGRWVSAFEDQPESFVLQIKEDNPQRIEYEQIVYNSNIKYKMDYYSTY
jgi:TolB-like protein